MRRAAAAEPAIDISCDSAPWRAARVDGLIRRAAREALEAAGVATAPGLEISILLTHDEMMAQLNTAWRGKQRPTNVLSFPAARPKGIKTAASHLGDVVLAYETVAAEAAEQGKRFRDHVAHLVVHGVLHLLGHDHETDRDAAVMEAREAAALARLDIANPYADDGTSDAAGTVLAGSGRAKA